MRNQVVQLRQECGALLCACALLCGTLYPLHSRLISVLYQRDILSNQQKELNVFKEQVKSLLDALSMDQTLTTSPRLLLRFRVAVVAVIAANRLLYWASHNSHLFTLTNAIPGCSSFLVCVGRVQPIGNKLTGKLCLICW